MVMTASVTQHFGKVQNQGGPNSLPAAVGRAARKTSSDRRMGLSIDAKSGMIHTDEGVFVLVAFIRQLGPADVRLPPARRGPGLGRRRRDEARPAGRGEHRRLRDPRSVKEFNLNYSFGSSYQFLTD